MAIENLDGNFFPGGFMYRKLDTAEAPDAERVAELVISDAYLSHGRGWGMRGVEKRQAVRAA